MALPKTEVYLFTFINKHVYASDLISVRPNNYSAQPYVHIYILLRFMYSLLGLYFALTNTGISKIGWGLTCFTFFFFYLLPLFSFPLSTAGGQSSLKIRTFPLNSTMLSALRSQFNLISILRVLIKLQIIFYISKCNFISL